MVSHFSILIFLCLKEGQLLPAYNSNLFCVITNVSRFVLNCTLLSSGGETLKI